MFAQLSHASAARPMAALAVALTLAFGLCTPAPAGADATQWTRNPSQWSNANGWNRPWRSQSQSNHGTSVIIGGGSGVIVTGPGIIVGSPGFVVGQPGLVVRRPNFIWQRPSFAKKQWQFIQRHPSLRVGQPWWHKNWSHRHWKPNKHWRNNGWRNNGWRNNGVRFTTPGMRFTTPGMRFTTQ